MPTTILGAAFFLVGLLPGLCYTTRIERHRPVTTNGTSVLRETGAIVIASVVLLSVALVLFSAARSLLPGHTPDIGALVRAHRSVYLRNNYLYVGRWALGVLLVACLLGFLTGQFDVIGKVDNKLSGQTGVRRESAWWTAFQLDAAADRYKYLQCRLDDGTSVEGTLYTYNPIADETDDRALQLSAPYFVMEPGSDEVLYVEGAIILSASRIRWIRVVYLTDEEYGEATRRPLRQSPKSRWSKLLAR